MYYTHKSIVKRDYKANRNSIVYENDLGWKILLLDYYTVRTRILKGSGKNRNNLLEWQT